MVSDGATFLLCGTAAVGVLSSFLLQQYAQREVNWLSFLTSLLGFVMSFGIIALIPYDVWEALTGQADQAGNIERPSQVLVDTSWEAIYWATSFLCWLLCPVLMEFEVAGDFTTAGRLKTSLRRNAVWYVLYMIAGSLILVWVFAGGGGILVSTGGGLVALAAWCMAASNAWGLLLSTFLMGFGLVAVPRHLWRLAAPGEQLQTLYSQAIAMDEARLSTQFELQDVISEARTELASRDTTVWDTKLERAFTMLQVTLEECELIHCELTNGARAPREENRGGRLQRGGDHSTRVDLLAQLHRALKQAGLEARRASCRWNDLVQTCLLLEDIEEQMFPSTVELASGSWQGGGCVSGFCARTICRWPLARTCWHSLMMLWLRTLRPRVLRVLAGICAVLSACIVLGQLTMFSNSWSFSLLSLLFQKEHGFGLTQLYCILPLSYMVCTAYWSVFRLKIAGWYGLYPNHNTDTASLLWCASILARLAAPLCYHFLLLIRVKGTAFQAMMGQMNVVPVLGKSFNDVFPCLVGFLCVCNLLNVYSRLVQLCGLDALEFEWGATSGGGDMGDLLAEGRRLVERERRRLSEDSLLQLQSRSSSEQLIPLRLQIAHLIDDGTLPNDWNSLAT